MSSIKVTGAGGLRGATGGRRSVDRSPEIYGQGLANFAQGAAQAQAANERIQQNASQAYVAKESSRIGLEMEQRLEQLRQGVDGADPGAFTADVAREMAALYEQELEAAPSLARGQLGNRMRDMIARVESQALAIESRAAIEHINLSFEEGANLDANQLLSSPDLWAEKNEQQAEAIQNLDVDPQFKQALLYEVTRTQSYGALSGRIMQPSAQDEEGEFVMGPERALRELKAGEWDERLSDDEKRTLINAAEREIAVRAKAAEAEYKADVKLLRDRVNDWVSATMIDRREGFFGNDQELLQAVELVDDPVIRADVQEVLQVRDMLVGFRTLGLAGMQARRDQFAAVLNNSGQSSDVQRRALAGMNTMISEMEELGRRDPIGGTVAAGIVRERAPLEFNAETGEGPTGDQWTAAYRQALVAADYYGVDSVGMLAPNQAAAMGNMLRNMAPDQAAAALGAMTQNLPDEYVKQIAGQLWGEDEETMATAVALSREAPRVTEQIIRGQAIVDSEMFQLTDPKLKAAIPDAYYTLFDQAPSVYDAMVPAAKAIYATLVPASELQSDREVDPDLMREALDMVSGGLVQMNNSETIAPRRGMTTDDMTELTENFVIGQFAADGFTFTRYGRIATPGGQVTPLGEGGIPGGLGGIMTPEKFARHATLRPHSDGVYYVMMGGKPILGANQQPFLLDVGRMADDYFAQKQPSPAATDRTFSPADAGLF